jgi:hypothetical protein
MEILDEKFIDTLHRWGDSTPLDYAIAFRGELERLRDFLQTYHRPHGSGNSRFIVPKDEFERRNTPEGFSLVFKKIPRKILIYDYATDSR